MGQLAAQLAMQLTVGRDQVLGHLVRGPVEGRELPDLLAPGVVAKNVLPCIATRVRQLVGRNAHHGTVLLKQGQDVEGKCALDIPNAEREARGPPEERAWVLCERVEGHIVKKRTDIVDDAGLKNGLC